MRTDREVTTSDGYESVNKDGMQEVGIALRKTSETT